MLREYQLTNFKAFAGPEIIPIRPITLIYGPNSSGKSSAIQSLLLLKQTLEEAENPEILLLPRGNLVDLGGYRDFIHRHEVERPLSFKVILDTGKHGPKTNSTLPKLLGLRVKFNYDKKTKNVILSSVEIFMDEASSPAVIYESPKRIPDPMKAFRRPGDIREEPSNTASATILNISRINYENSFVHSSLINFQQRVAKQGLKEVSEDLQENKRLEEELEVLHQQNQLPRAEQRLKPLENKIETLKILHQRFQNYTFEKAREDFSTVTQDSCLIYRHFLPVTSELQQGERTADPEIQYFLKRHRLDWLPDIGEITITACSTFRDFIQSSVYIGPLRDYPERLYISSGNSSQQVGKSGKMVSNILFKNSELLEQVNEQLERFELGYKLEVAEFTDENSDLSDVFALRLVDNLTGVKVSLLDVGFGISQVLPIIVQSMLSRNKTILIEQPEIHIHPRLQAQFGSLLAKCIKPPFNNRFIIETHSEHLMLRLQRLIRKGEQELKITPENVSVVYVMRGAKGSKCKSLRLDAEGDFIDRWPGGFFQEDYNEIFKK